MKRASLWARTPFRMGRVLEKAVRGRVDPTREQTKRYSLRQAASTVQPSDGEARGLFGNSGSQARLGSTVIRADKFVKDFDR